MRGVLVLALTLARPIRWWPVFEAGLQSVCQTKMRVSYCPQLSGTCHKVEERLGTKRCRVSHQTLPTPLFPSKDSWAER